VRGPSLRGLLRSDAHLLRAGITTTFALGILALLITGSLPAAGAMVVASGVCVWVVLRWVRGREAAAVVPEGALWSGRATVRVTDLLGCPLLDTVDVGGVARLRRRASRGALGDLVVDGQGLTWTATWVAGLGGVRGSFVLPWSAVVKAQAAAIPSATPGSGAIGISFADGTKLDVAFAGNYAGFRAALTRLPEPIPGLAS